MSPIFILGFPRSGTTALASAVSTLKGVKDFSHEGHIFYLFRDALRRVREGELNPNCILNRPDSKNNFFVAIRRAFNEAFSGDKHCQAWIDKTPDIQQIRAVPELYHLFPQARFLYIYRPPLEAVRSNLATWPSILADREQDVAQRWAECSHAWRQVRLAIPGPQRLQIFQPDMLAKPGATADRMAAFLNADTDETQQLRTFLKGNKKINRPKGQNAEAAYEARQLSDAQADRVRQITAKECAAWPRLAL